MSKITPSLMLNIINKLFDSNEKQIQKITPFVRDVNAHEESVSALTDEQLQDKTRSFRETLGFDIGTARAGEKVDFEAKKAKMKALLPEIFAVAREVTKRVANHRHYDVQLMAGYFLFNNKVVELFTGEGKTNSAVLALYAHAISGRGAHLITVNDYLARRDGEWTGHVFNALGLSVGVINSGTQYRFASDDEAISLKGDTAKELIEERKGKTAKTGMIKLDYMFGANLVECTKKEAYACDVVYGTNNEFGFDYLRDNMVANLKDRVQGPLHFAIIDEADSILIDEARTPLIISQSADASNDLYVQFAKIAGRLNPEEDYVLDEKARAVSITDAGIDKVEKLLNVQNVYEDAQFAYHLDNALKAKELYKKDDEYIIREGEIVIVDEFTGRALPGRRYSEGLHQAIEAKEGVEVQRESKTLATITLQNYFRMYEGLGGMTGTALTEAEELAKIYDLDVIVVPSNRKLVRKDETDLVYKTTLGKFKAIVQEIIEAHKVGQPVLVGTTSVEKSEFLSELLKKEGIPHNVLNAKNHAMEAQIVSQAGQKGSVTIATNMAGRGTDIALGEEVADVGGLYVIGSERHESRRIDNQLRGRSGRQGDPGKTRFYVSFEDELLRLFGGDSISKIMGNMGMDEDMPIEFGILGRTIENAQKKVEAQNYDIRKRLVEYDDVLNQQREIIYGMRRRILELGDQFAEDDRRDPLQYDEVKLEKADLKDLNIYAVQSALTGFSLQLEESWKAPELEKFPELAHPLNLWAMSKLLNTVDELNLTEDPEKLKGLVTEELVNLATKLLDGEKWQDLSAVQLVVAAYILHATSLGKRAMVYLVKMLALEAIDTYWMEHLDAMADLREGIGMRQLAQRDPLVEYKNEGFKMFERMLEDIENSVVNRIFKVRVAKQPAVASAQTQNLSGPAEPGRALGKTQKSAAKVTGPLPNGEIPKVGKDDPCPCGSGKKYKKCHGKKQKRR